MSRLKMSSFVIRLLVWCVLAVVLGASCADLHIGGTCDETVDCYTPFNFSGTGTMCILGVCRCPDAKEDVCCPGGGSHCDDENYRCRPGRECFPVEPECTVAAECPGSPDPRCGEAHCVEGQCELETWAGKAIDNQTPGDCKRKVCSAKGDVEIWEDPSDVPTDLNPCTFDVCNGGMPDNPRLPDTSPCPGEDSGICVVGTCKDCSSALGWSFCPVGGQTCQEDTCVPVACTDNNLGQLETDIDCGGPVCRPCEQGQPCKEDRDCLSKVCDPTTLLCKKSAHNDNVHNDSETGVDCGYQSGQSQQCKDGEGCTSSGNCMSHVCYLGHCQPPSCLDGVKNGLEAGEDCGEAAGCPPCL